MIQSILFFCLGFLSSALIALLIAPAIWRRAVALTTKRVEASIPMSMEELHAAKDRLRAEHAVTVRRLEQAAERLNRKNAEQAVKLARDREELKRLTAERVEQDAAMAALVARYEDADRQLGLRDEEIARLSDALDASERRVADMTEELERLGALFEEESLRSSNRQIELVARETEVEKLTGDIAILKSERKDAERRIREVMADNKAAQEALRAERRRLSETEKKIERLVASLSDRDEKLERRETELARLRDELRGRPHPDYEAQIAELRAENLRLEAELAAGGAGTGGNSAALEKAIRDRRRLEERLTVLTRENKKLRADGGAAAAAAPLAGEERENEALREEMLRLAARIAQLTAEAEGPGSPIHSALGTQAPSPAGSPPSLADRIRELQAAEGGAARTQER